MLRLLHPSIHVIAELALEVQRAILRVHQHNIIAQILHPSDRVGVNAQVFHAQNIRGVDEGPVLPVQIQN